MIFVGAQLFTHMRYQQIKSYLTIYMIFLCVCARAPQAPPPPPVAMPLQISLCDSDLLVLNRTSLNSDIALLTVIRWR